MSRLKEELLRFAAFCAFMAVAAYFGMRGLGAIHEHVLHAVHPAGYGDSFDVTVWIAGAGLVARSAWDLS